MLRFDDTNHILKLLPLLVFVLVLASCKGMDATPEGIATFTSFEEYDELYDRYIQQMEARQNEISVAIEATQMVYKPDEEIEFQVTITNLTDHKIVVRRPDADLDYFMFPTPMDFTLTSDNPDINIELVFPPGFIDGIKDVLPDEFVVIEPQNTFSCIVPLIPRLRLPLSEGKYSVVGTYENYLFGADTEDYYTDLNAWMGTIETNSVTFEVVH